MSSVLAPRRVLVLVNERSRRGVRALDEGLHRLEDRGIHVVVERMGAAHPPGELLRKHAVDAVVVGGGDGTLNRVVDDLVEIGLPLGVWPLGTGNDLARTLGIPTALAAASDVIAGGVQKRIDLGWVNGKYFFNVASIGVSAEVTRQLAAGSKRRLGSASYLLALGRALRQARVVEAEIRAGDRVLRTRALQVAVGNGRHYGGGMTVTASSAIDDQVLDVFTVEPRSRWQLLRLLPALRLGKLDWADGVEVLHARELDVVTSEPRTINTDGELTRRTPAHFRVVPRALGVFVPESAAEGDGHAPA